MVSKLGDETRRCVCNSILTADILTRIAREMSEQEELTPFITSSINNAVTALNNVKETCKINVDDVLGELGAAQGHMALGHDDAAFSAAYHASELFKKKFCAV